jgi:hypothetical protein
VEKQKDLLLETGYIIKDCMERKIENQEIIGTAFIDYIFKQN